MPKIKRIQKRPFDLAISLGGDCQPAHQLERMGYRSASFPLDWIGTKFEALYKLLNLKFKDFLLKQNLELVPGKYVLEKKYRVKLLHDFKWNEGVFLEDYNLNYDKYQRRILRFLEVLESGKRILLVRRKCTKDQAIKLRNIIEKVYPKCNFALMILDETEEMKKPWGIRGIYNHYLRQPDPWRWRGLDSEWNRIFYYYRLPKQTL